MEINRSRSLVFSFYFAIGLAALLIDREGNAFQPMRLTTTPSSCRCRCPRFDGTRRIRRSASQGGLFRTIHCSALFAAPSNNKESDSVEKLFNFDNNNFENEIEEDDMEEIESGQPSQWMIMQQLLGINIFTVVLALLIVFFLGMNFALGPGWLGSTIGIPGTGSIQEVSPSLPGSINLNRPEYRL